MSAGSSHQASGVDTPPSAHQALGRRRAALARSAAPTSSLRPARRLKHLVQNAIAVASECRGDLVEVRHVCGVQSTQHLATRCNAGAVYQSSKVFVTKDNIKKLGRAEEILKARARAGGELTADDGAEEEEEDLTDPEVIANKARALKKAGWMEPTSEEAALEAAE